MECELRLLKQGIAARENVVGLIPPFGEPGGLVKRPASGLGPSCDNEGPIADTAEIPDQAPGRCGPFPGSCERRAQGVEFPHPFGIVGTLGQCLHHGLFQVIEIRRPGDQVRIAVNEGEGPGPEAQDALHLLPGAGCRRVGSGMGRKERRQGGILQAVDFGFQLLVGQRRAMLPEVRISQRGCQSAITVSRSRSQAVYPGAISMTRSGDPSTHSRISLRRLEAVSMRLWTSRTVSRPRGFGVGHFSRRVETLSMPFGKPQHPTGFLGFVRLQKGVTGLKLHPVDSTARQSMARVQRCA